MGGFFFGGGEGGWSLDFMIPGDEEEVRGWR
jgi:hypothetical protein